MNTNQIASWCQKAKAEKICFCNAAEEDGGN